MSKYEHDNLRGYIVNIQTADGEYEGTVKNVSQETGKIVLEHVITLPTGRKLLGVQNFFPHEIRSQVVIGKSDVSPKKSVARLPEEAGPRLIKLGPLPLGYKSAQIAVDSEAEDPISDTEEPVEPYVKNGPINWNVGNVTNVTKPSTLQFQLPDVFAFIDTLESEFENAISAIESYAIIGVSVEGANLGRDGDLYWIVISTKQCVYLFDVLTLEDKGFSMGLKQILESSTIMKVFHDCRLASDLLFHKYGVNLENVFDTQVADLVNYCRHHKNMLPDFAKSVSGCVSFYLRLDPAYVECPKVRLACMEKDLYEWQRRPLTYAYRDAAIRRVVYLRELRVTILEHLLSDLNEGINHYLSVVRDASTQEVTTLNLGAGHLIPPGLNKIGYHAANGMNRYNSRISDKGSTTNGIRSRAFENNMSVGDILDALDAEIRPQSSNKRQMIRRSLPNDLLSRPRDFTSSRGAGKMHSRSRTTPCIKKTPPEVVVAENRPTLVNGHHGTEMDAKLNSDETTVQSNGTEVMPSTSGSCYVKNNLPRDDAMDTGENGADSTALGESTSRWPYVCPIQTHFKNVVPSGMLL